METRLLIMVGSLSLIVGIGPAKVWAEEGTIVKRELNQQHRIGEGVKSGQLTAKETGRLEKGERKIEKNREKAWSDGNLSPAEKARLEHEENRESRKIYNLKHNDTEAPAGKGPIVRREVNQQNRIAKGVKSGQLTAGETTRLEKGERKIEKNREKAWSDGKLSAREKGRLEHQENHESRQIFRAKHNARKR